MNADNKNSVFYDITVTATIGCETVSDTIRIAENELDDVVRPLTDAGERFSVRKVTVIDSIRNRQTGLRPTRFGYLHNSPTVAVGNKAVCEHSVNDVVAPRGFKPKAGQIDNRYNLPPLREGQIAIGTAERAVDIKECKPQSAQQKIFSSELGLCKDHNWRPLTGTGHIHAIDRISGTAIATDGVLIAIRQHSDNSILIGHLDNWVKDIAAAVGGNGRKRRMSKTALLDELFA